MSSPELIFSNLCFAGIVFFQILDFGFVCHTIRNNTERDTIYFCKVRRRMNRSNILLSSLKTEIFRTETRWNLYDRASSFSNNLRSRERFHLSHLSLTGNYCYYYCYCFFFNLFTLAIFINLCFAGSFLILVSSIKRSGDLARKLCVF